MRLTILNMDPPKHNRYRRLVSKGFTPRMIAALVEEIERRAAVVIDDVCEKGEVEFVEEIAAQVPVQMICEMIGLEPETWPRMFEVSNHLIGSRDDPDFQELAGGPQAAAMEVYALCDAVAADRRENPRDDIMTALVQAEVDGERLDDARAQPVLHHARRGRQRDHAEPDQPLDARPHRQPGPGAAPARRPVALGHGDGRDAAVGQLDPQLPPHRDVRHRAARRADQGRATRSSSTTPPPTATRTCSRTRTASTWDARPTTTSPSAAAACTTASAPAWPGPRSAPRCARSSSDSPTSSWRARSNRLHSDFVNGVKTMPVRFTPTSPT